MPRLSAFSTGLLQNRVDPQIGWEKNHPFAVHKGVIITLVPYKSGSLWNSGTSIGTPKIWGVGGPGSLPPCLEEFAVENAVTVHSGTFHKLKICRDACLRRKLVKKVRKNQKNDGIFLIFHFFPPTLHIFNLGNVLLCNSMVYTDCIKNVILSIINMGSYLWNVEDPHPITIYLLDRHQKMNCFHWSVLSPGSNLGMWSCPLGPISERSKMCVNDYELLIWNYFISMMKTSIDCTILKKSGLLGARSPDFSRMSLYRSILSHLIH
jgi:hypothetical protein